MSNNRSVSPDRDYARYDYQTTQYRTVTNMRTGQQAKYRVDKSALSPAQDGIFTIGIIIFGILFPPFGIFLLISFLGHGSSWMVRRKRQKKAMRQEEVVREQQANEATQKREEYDRLSQKQKDTLKRKMEKKIKDDEEYEEFLRLKSKYEDKL